MRSRRINAFYYPDFWLSVTTLKKAILLFDELHFMDRPSFMFGHFGLVGAASPLRQYEESFRDAGVPMFVHGAPGGPVKGILKEEISADIDDHVYLERFQRGLRDSATFRGLHIQQGNYGPNGDDKAVVEKLVNLDLAEVVRYGKASELFYDKSIRPFDLSTSIGCAKQLVSTAAACSSKMNFALRVSAERGWVPLADASPYGELLSAKYRRAINNVQPKPKNLLAADLSFAIFDELISTERLAKLSIEQVVRYRKASEAAREAFLEYVSLLEEKQASITVGEDYPAEIDRIVRNDVLPASREFKRKLEAIGDSLFGEIIKATAKGTAALVGSVQLLGGLTLERILTFADASAAYMVKVGVDAVLADRAARRECSLSYILSLDE